MLSNNSTTPSEPTTTEKKLDDIDVAEIHLKDAQTSYSENQKGVALARYLGVLLIAKKYDDFNTEQKARATSAIIQSLTGIANINNESHLLDSLEDKELGNIGEAVFTVSKNDEFQKLSKSESKMSFLLTTIVKNARMLCEKEDEKDTATLTAKKTHAESTCGFFTRKAVRATVIGVPVGILTYSLYCAGLLTAASTIAWGALYGVAVVGTGMALKDGYNKIQSRGPK